MTDINVKMIEQIMVLMERHLVDEVVVAGLTIKKTQHLSPDASLGSKKESPSDEDLLFYSAE